MATELFDVQGLRCPQPVMKVAAKSVDMPPGSVLEVLADCPSFPRDIQTWCERAKKMLLFCRDEGGGKFRAQVQF